MAQTGIDQSFRLTLSSSLLAGPYCNLRFVSSTSRPFFFPYISVRTTGPLLYKNSSINVGSYLLKRKHIIHFLIFHVLLTHPGHAQQ